VRSRARDNVPPCNVWLDELEHLEVGLVDTDESSIVDLSESEELKDSANLWGNTIDTSDSDNDGQFRLRVQEVVTSGARCSSGLDSGSLCGSVFLHILLCSLQHARSSGLTGSLFLLSLRDGGGSQLLTGLALLEHTLGHKAAGRSGYKCGV
jgi:hypothetical protein